VRGPFPNPTDKWGFSPPKKIKRVEPAFLFLRSAFVQKDKNRPTGEKGGDAQKRLGNLRGERASEAAGWASETSELNLQKERRKKSEKGCEKRLRLSSSKRAAGGEWVQLGKEDTQTPSPR